MSTTMLTPHLGGCTVLARDNIDKLLLDNLAAFFSGKPLVTPLTPLGTESVV